MAASPTGLIDGGGAPLAVQELRQAAPSGPTVLTIGVFDGVHLGHRHLLSTTKRLAAERGLLAGAVTFRQHPQTVLRPGTSVLYLTDLEERVRLLRQAGADVVAVLTFNPELSRLSAREFVALLQGTLQMRGLVVGPDFALGHGREGNPRVLAELGTSLGFSVEVCQPLVQGGVVVSSTLIRQAVGRGDVSQACSLLGRPFSLTGVVAVGRQRGRTLGFPTANLQVAADRLVPANGIYVTRGFADSTALDSVTSVGVKPTFDETDRTVETYCLDFEGNLYGKNMRLEFLERLRPEAKFNSIEELQAQIARDVQLARVRLRALR